MRETGGSRCPHTPGSTNGFNVMMIENLFDPCLSDYFSSLSDPSDHHGTEHC